MKKVVLFLTCTVLTFNLIAQEYDDLYYNSKTDNKNNRSLDKQKQNDPSIPKKGDNLILITTNRNPQENFIDFGKYLILNGFSFNKKDVDFLYLETSPKNAQGQVEYSFLISFTDSIIRIKAKYTSVSAASLIVGGQIQVVWYDWSYVSVKSDFRNLVFKKFDPILKEYNSRIEYKIE